MATCLRLRAHGLAPPTRRPPITGDVPQNVAEVLDPIVAADPDRMALIGRTGRFSFGELDAVVNRAAAVLSGLGVGAYDRVAACLPNDVDIVIAFLASQRLGAIWVGINKPLAGSREGLPAEGQRGSGLSGDSGGRGGDASVHRRSSRPRPRGDRRPGRELPAEGSWAARLAAVPFANRPEVEIDPFAPAAIAYTSGRRDIPRVRCTASTTC